MTTTYAGTATAHASIEVPADDDEPTGALFAAPFMDLLDEIRLTSAAVRGAGAAKGWWIPHNALRRSNVFAFNSSGNVGQTGVGSVGYAEFAFEIPIAGRITAIIFLAYGPAGHGGVLPTTMPHYLLKTYDPVTNATATLLDLTDFSANTTSYEALTEHASAAVNITINPLLQYLIEITGEHGGSAQVGFTLMGVFIQVTP